MRVLVRIVGILLMVWGGTLWKVERVRSFQALRVSNTVTVRHSPPSRSRSTVSAQTVSPKENAGPVLSSVRAYERTDYGRLFHVDLFKKDRWFDTGIPVDADVRVMIVQTTASEKPGLVSVEGRIGKFLVERENNPHHSGMTVDTTADGHEVRDIAPDLQRQILTMSASEQRTLKFHITGDGPETVGFEVNVVNSQLPGVAIGFTPSQQRERDALNAWRPK